MISVCLTSYNGESFIRQQISSILKQIGPADEIIISDDGSTDSTLTIIDSFNDRRIKVFKNKPVRRSSKYKFHNVTLNFENCIKNAGGDFIYLADQDDIWIDGKVAACQQSLLTNILVITDCVIINESGDVLHHSYFQRNNSKAGILRNMFLQNAYLGCCMAFKRDLIKHILPMSKFLVPHDIWIGLLAEYYGRVDFLPQALVEYRRHGKNASPSGGRSSNSILFKVDYRLKLLAAFIKRISN